MKLRSLLSFAESENLAVGINLQIRDHLQYEISFCVLKKTGNNISVLQNSHSFETIDGVRTEVEAFLQKGTRLHINMEGKGLLMKNIPFDGSQSDSDLLAQAFPGIKTNEFVIQKYIGDGTVFLILVRNDLLTMLDYFSLSKFSWVSFSLGPFVAEKVISLSGASTIQIGRQVLSLVGGKIGQVASSDMAASSIIQVAETEIDGETFLAYASAFNVFFPIKGLSTTGLPYVEGSRSSFSLNREIYHTAKTVSLILLVILFVNALLFFWLSQKTEEVEVQLSFLKGKTQVDEENLKRSMDFRKFNTEFGWAHNDEPLFYADEIGKTVSNGIQLTSLEMGIVDLDRLRKDKKRVFDPQKIRVAGVSTDPVALSEWLKKIRDLSWIHEVKEQKYTYDARMKKGTFEFIISTKDLTAGP